MIRRLSCIVLLLSLTGGGCKPFFGTNDKALTKSDSSGPVDDSKRYFYSFPFVSRAYPILKKIELSGKTSGEVNAVCIYESPSNSKNLSVSDRLTKASPITMYAVAVTEADALDISRSTLSQMSRVQSPMDIDRAKMEALKKTVTAKPQNLAAELCPDQFPGLRGQQPFAKELVLRSGESAISGETYALSYKDLIAEHAYIRALTKSRVYEGLLDAKSDASHLLLDGQPALNVADVIKIAVSADYSGTR